MSAADISDYKNICKNKDNLKAEVDPTFETSSMFSILQAILHVIPVQERTCSYKVQINGRYGHERTERITRSTDCT
jgi:hypothetical protein